MTEIERTFNSCIISITLTEGEESAIYYKVRSELDRMTMLNHLEKIKYDDFYGRYGVCYTFAVNHVEDIVELYRKNCDQCGMNREQASIEAMWEWGYICRKRRG